ncbi:peroxidase-like protein 3 [Acyrthosiphon pisum]|uniref:Uncharacterized protein n=1 Tax=Acyrthosiphon pisum TaxID=7029 RepID=A0A8R2JMU3_ACYPI|nr:peroxidase-like protein 3 [Acyrthosiphon pisum]
MLIFLLFILISESAIRIPERFRRVDLVSIDMARGRDYGEPSYNKFRKLCGLSEAKTFDSLIDQMDKKHVEALSKMYEHVDDIDYYVAGMLEKPKPGSLLGHTFQCDVGLLERCFSDTSTAIDTITNSGIRLVLLN